mgnify:CR=1 FL=1
MIAECFQKFFAFHLTIGNDSVQVWVFVNGLVRFQVRIFINGLVQVRYVAVASSE